MLGNHQAIDIPQSTPYAAEMRKWEAYPTKYGAAGRPYQFREFPKALYRFKREAGQGIVKDDMRIVNDEHEERNLLSRGYFASQEEAVAEVEREHVRDGELAAERNFEIARGRISEKAAAEVRAAEAEHGASHLPVVPETPIVRRGRKPKAQEEA